MADVFFSDAADRYSRAVDLEQAIRSEWKSVGSPLLAEGSMGQLVEHPLVKMLKEAERDSARFLELVGKRRPGRPVGATSAPDRPVSAEPPKLRLAK